MSIIVDNEWLSLGRGDELNAPQVKNVRQSSGMVI